MTSAPPLPPVNLDPAAAHPEIAQLRNALHHRDWPAVEEFFGRFGEADADADADARFFLARVVGETHGVEALLKSVLDTGNLARVLLAARHIEIAWEARGDYEARHVEADQWEVFGRNLNHAERLLIDATAHDPADAAAWALRINVCMGLSLGQSEAQRRYRRLARHHPHPFLAQSRMVQQLCPKWGGTWEEAHAFARECMRVAPEGAPNGALVAEAHLERWLSLGTKAGYHYLRQPAVQAELTEAAQRSVLHPAFRKTFGWVQAHGYFAMAFATAGVRELAAPHFAAMGGFATQYPWAYSGFASDVFTTLRGFALGRR